MTRTVRAALPLVWMASVLVGCKRPPPPSRPDVWDDVSSERGQDAESDYGPKWPAPIPALLRNGLLHLWMHEPGTATTHLRLLVPLHDGPPSEVAAIVAEALRHDLARQGRRHGALVDVVSGPGRVEIAMHAPSAALDDLLNALAQSLGVSDPAPGLLAAQKRLARDRRNLDSTELALDRLAATLLADDNPGLVEPAALADVGRVPLAQGWSRLLDPHRAVLLVHAGLAPSAHATALLELDARWASRTRTAASASALARLRPTTPPPDPSDKSLVGGPAAAPIQVIATNAHGGAVLALGRLLETPRWEDRAMARLAQRIAQEELDVRLSISGDRALWTVVLPFSGPDAPIELDQTLDHLSRLARQREPSQRLRQAAQLWLGGRMVASSLAGEDWTALLSESLDLADRDTTVSRALGRDAQFMMDVDPDTLAAWTRQHLDPRGSSRGWDWTIAGSPPRILEQLGTARTLERAP